MGSKIIFAEFTSVSEDIQVALNFAQNETLFIIRIENNNPPNYYCNNICNLSCFKNEKEILITSNCIYHITKIENKEVEDDGKNSPNKIYLTCEGFKVDNFNKPIPVVNKQECKTQ